MFENCKVVKKANIYFDGKVTSRKVILADNSEKTLGFMLKGNYTFNTGAKELMEIIGGSMQIKISGQDEFRTYNVNDSFEVPANSSFECIVDDYADYICSYGD